MVLGFPRLEDYLHHSRSHGAIVGRVANRTAGARFTLDGETYALTAERGREPPARRRHRARQPDLGRWRPTAPPTRCSSSTAAPTARRAIPGAVDFAVTFRLEGPRLICEMAGMPDRPTPISLANHSYYNLGGGGTVKDHLLWVDARDYTPTDADLIPTGEIRPLEGTRLRLLRAEREIGDTAARPQPRARPRPATASARPPGRAARAPGVSSSSGPTSRACSSSTPPR